MAESTSWTDPEDPIPTPPTTRETKTPPAPFYLDDAFSDGDENDDVLEFSSQSLRAELAKSLSPTTDEDTEDAQNITPSMPNASVSTLDMNGHTDSPPSVPESTLTSPPTLSPSVHHAPELVSHSPSSQFEQISLSDSSAAETPDLETPPRRHSEGSQGEGSTGSHLEILPTTEDDHETHPEHQKSPAVHPEAMSPRASEEATHSPPASQVIVIPPHSPSSPPSGPDTARTSSFEHRRPPSTAGHGQRTVSTPSLAIPSTPKTAPIRPSTSHKPTRSTGPSTFEKVVSRTRPSFLPPKTREEDNKHLADWEKMMKQSRVAEEKRRQALAERRLAREQKIEESLHRWEKEIVPDWKVVDKNPALRRLWWAGIPSKLRASLWERAVGNALALSKDSYRICLARAKRALAAGTFPTTTLSLIEEDVETTLPSIHIFHPETGPMYEDLKEMLYAWVVARSDEGLGYTKGVAKIAAMILLNMPAVQGFIVMRNLLERQCMRAFYGGMATKDEVEAYYRIFDTLLADGMPKIYFNFKQHQISPAAYLPEWIVPLFLDHLPFEACARIWDVILLEGDAFVYRASLAILAVLEPRLFFPDRQELLELLRGQNKAALEVAKRDGRPLNGGRYEIYGVDEETLWDRIDGMDDWWRESTWTRLLQRELPDL
ncbi:RabGAP/TBC [Dentipellis sp. KUC8613]|nr:RabGAP/TBC [Dentipellis sp. KUC8613]